MTRSVKQSMTITVKMGPFVDKTDGVTPEILLSPTVKLAKNGGVLTSRNSVTAITHDVDGYYAVELNTIDTNTLGSLQAVATDSANHLPVYHELMVMPANIWDSMVGGTDLVQVDVQEIDGNTASPTSLDAAARGAVPGAIVAGSTNSIYNTNLTETTDTHYKDRVVVFLTGALAGQALRITAYNGTTKALTVQSLTTDVPANADTFVIV